jgi:hypothetical protein
VENYDDCAAAQPAVTFGELEEFEEEVADWFDEGLEFFGFVGVKFCFCFCGGGWVLG